MNKERMSEERFAFVRESIESNLKSSYLMNGAPDRQFDSFKVNKELLTEIDALRAELAARTPPTSDELAETLKRVRFSCGIDTSDRVQRAFARLEKAERERDSALAERDEARKALRRAKQFVSVASDWNFDECEIDGVMVRTHEFASELEAVLESKT